MDIATSGVNPIFLAKLATVYGVPTRRWASAGGVVYYANYLKFMERARTEWLRSLGFEQDELMRDPGVVFAVRSCSLEFLKPARFNDRLDVSLRVARSGRASLTLDQQILRGSETLCEGTVRIACLDAQRFTPAPIPAAIAACLPDRGAT